MFSDVVYYHCSEFQIFRPLNGSHFSALSLYPNSVQNQAYFVYIFLTTSNQNKLTSFSHVLYLYHWLIMGGFPAKIDQSLVFPLCFTQHYRMKRMTGFGWEGTSFCCFQRGKDWFWLVSRGKDWFRLVSGWEGLVSAHSAF